MHACAVDDGEFEVPIKWRGIYWFPIHREKPITTNCVESLI